jgi:hypothetical protein
MAKLPGHVSLPRGGLRRWFRGENAVDLVGSVKAQTAGGAYPSAAKLLQFLETQTSVGTSGLLRSIVSASQLYPLRHSGKR